MGTSVVSVISPTASASEPESGEEGPTDAPSPDAAAELDAVNR